MKLVELNPQWIMRNGDRVGIVFRCPHCLDKTPRVHLTCFKVAPTKIAGDDPDSQYGLLIGLVPGDEMHEVVPCKRGNSWAFTGDALDSLSITPSIDAGASGHWHGSITNGECA